MLEKYGVMIWEEFIWLRMGSSGGLFWTEK